jgi:DNA-binding CsgD family transcriptional regulator/tetratricopeptide (TPR) repeat protein
MVPSATSASHGAMVNRQAERAQLDGLLEDARAGASAAVVVRGEAGVGKTALVDYVRRSASTFRVVRAAGVESEMELPFAALQQLCAPMLDELARLPDPQREALSTAFGLSDGPPPNRFLVGLAVLSLFADVAEKQPLVCLVDDAQWLDTASAQVLGFAARRLTAEAVVIMFAVREPSDGNDLAGLAELTVGPLGADDARDLLATAIAGRLDEAVRDRILAEAQGNPLALLELPRAWTPAAFAGGYGLGADLSVSARIEESFRRRAAPLPEDSRRLMLLAAADPVGDPVLVWAAADRLGIPPRAAAAAREAGLLDIGTRVRFLHPLVRTVIYRDAPLTERRIVHAALANATDPEADPDRHAWHRAQAAAGLDEEVALELERSAGRAQARGGLAAAAAFIQRSTALTQDPGRRSERALAAGQASLQAGAFDQALALLAVAEGGSLDELQRAQAKLIRGHVGFASGLAPDAPRMLLEAAGQLEPFDLQLARETYVTAWGAAMFTEQRDVVLEISGAIRALPPSRGGPHPLDLLLQGIALLTMDGTAAAAPTLQQAATELADISLDDVLRWGWMANEAGYAVWADDGQLELAARHVRLVRDAGALADLPVHLNALGIAYTWSGDLANAATCITEADSVAKAIGASIAPYTALRVAALRGREAEATALIESAVGQAAAGGPGMAGNQAHWAAATMYNGLGRYDEAASSARQASKTFEPCLAMWASVELVEAAARGGEVEVARGALERLVATTQPCGTDFALGIEARSRALLHGDSRAEESYREAVNRLGRTRFRPELARAHLVYGEWLRRAGRRVDAREQLRAAYDLFVSMGMEAFAERSRRELVATGETVRKRSVETQHQLTPQELQIARLAIEGRTNAEIGAQLFLSQRTVEWHLRKVFDKLEIRSRRELPRALRR